MSKSSGEVGEVYLQNTNVEEGELRDGSDQAVELTNPNVEEVEIQDPNVEEMVRDHLVEVDIHIASTDGDFGETHNINGF